MRYIIIIFLLIPLFCIAEEPPKNDKGLDEKLKQQRALAELKQATDNAKDEEARKVAKAKLKEMMAREQDKKELAEFAQKTLSNLGDIKEMFTKAEESWKNQKYGEAGLLYTSVSKATVPGAEEMAETSRGRIIEMEDLAKTHLKAADDYDLKRNYIKEAEELVFICQELYLTKTKEIALRRIITLKSKPEISGYIEFAQAEQYEIDGKKDKAKKAYEIISLNPRYINTLPSLKAKNKLEKMEKTEEKKP